MTVHQIHNAINWTIDVGLNVIIWGCYAIGLQTDAFDHFTYEVKVVAVYAGLLVTICTLIKFAYSFFKWLKERKGKRKFSKKSRK